MAKQTSLDLNGPIVSFDTQPVSGIIKNKDAYSVGIRTDVIESYSIGGTSYPVRGYLYAPLNDNLPDKIDLVILYHGTIATTGVVPFKPKNDTSPLSSAAETFLDIVTDTRRLNIRDKVIFSVAYPQDYIPAWQVNSNRPALEFPGLDYPNFYLGDNLVYAEAALLWARNNINTFMASKGIGITTDRVFTFGHSQGASLTHKLNTLHQVDGVISNAPGPIDLLARCSDSEANGDNNFTCSKIRTGIGSTLSSPSSYTDVSVKNYLSGTLSPSLFTQALDDTTGNDEGVPQVSNMQNIVQVGLSTCTNCESVRFNYYDKGYITPAGINTGGGHDAFAYNKYMQKDIREFVGSSGAGTTTFVGIATASFPIQIPSNPAVGTGSLSYRWYELNVGPLTDGPTISGSATSTVTLSDLLPSKNGQREFYLTADYIPSAYGLPGVAVTVGSARSTGNALNDLSSTNSAVLTIYPNIDITSEPLDKSVVQNTATTFTVEAELTDGSDPSLLSYQWFVNCGVATDGVIDYIPICPGTIISEPIIDITNESTGQTVAVNFSNGLIYDTFDPGIVYTLVPRGNIAATLRLAGGKGGSENRAGLRGGFGGYAQGKFTFITNQTYKVMVGGRGTDSINDGGIGNAAAQASGGGNKSRSWNPVGAGAQGGGYTGLFKDTILQSNSIIIAGGGGGANRDPGQGVSGGGVTGLNDGSNQGPGRTGGSGTQTAGGGGTNGGNPGSALKGGDGLDSLYASGGGGGYFGGSGGGGGGVGGGGSGYLHPTLINEGQFATLATGSFPGNFSGGGFNGREAGRFQIIGIGTAGSSGFYRNTISGANSKTLTISSATLGSQNVYCRISHPTACNSPVVTRTAEFNTIAAKGMLKFESIGLTDTAAITEWDLTSQGPYEITYDSTNNSNVFVSFYPSEKDVEVNIQMYGKKGNSKGSYQGGEGGFSSINLTLEKNVEYVITGLFDAIGAPAIYRKGSLLAIVGAGGDAGSGGRGGDGGGIGIAGEGGQGTGSGNGGDVFAVGTLPENGYWYGAYTGTVLPPETINQEPLGGGRITPCTRGDYWRNQGFAACSDVGSVKFRRSNGNEVTNTAEISRGFKSGLVMNNNKGIAISNGGNGGAGQNGGSGGSQGGGGGGSGYTDGTVTLISTEQGGGTGVARVVISAA